MTIEQLRKLAGHEEIDYIFVMTALQNYARPREKLSTWLRKGALIRVKKGLYVFGQAAAMQPYSAEVLANRIYGPSAVSLAYALSWHGLIPERVETITSITPKRNKTFTTPIGKFSYRYIHPKKYPYGIEIARQANDQLFYIACAEKALCDQMYLQDRQHKLHNLQQLEQYLLADLRLDESILLTMDLTKLTKLITLYKHPNLTLLLDYLTKRRINNA